MAEQQRVLVDVRDAVGTVTINRPEALNALDADVAVALHEQLRALAADARVRCVVLRGAGGHFMAGGDLEYFRAHLAQIRASQGRDLHPLFEHIHGTVETIRGMPQPVVASVCGAVAGYGLSLMLTCDLAIAADDSKFTMAYCHIGSSPDGGSTWFLPRIVGLRRAAELALLGERFDVARAAELGIVNTVVPVAQLESATAALAARLARGPQAAYARTKQLLNRSLEQGMTAQLAAERDAFVAGAQSEDFAEGVTAFCEKRKPDFA